jgi:hypothetical protein
VLAPGFNKGLQDEGGRPDVRGIDPVSDAGILILEMSACRGELDLVDELIA